MHPIVYIIFLFTCILWRTISHHQFSIFYSPFPPALPAPPFILHKHDRRNSSSVLKRPNLRRMSKLPTRRLPIPFSPALGFPPWISGRPARSSIRGTCYRRAVGRTIWRDEEVREHLLRAGYSKGGGGEWDYHRDGHACRGDEIVSTILILHRFWRYVTEALICFSAWSLGNLGLQGHVEDVCISADHQGQQFGTKLIKTLDQIAADRGCYKVSFAPNSARNTAVVDVMPEYTWLQRSKAGLLWKMWLWRERHRDA